MVLTGGREVATSRPSTGKDLSASVQTGGHQTNANERGVFDWQFHVIDDFHFIYILPW